MMINIIDCTHLPSKYTFSGQVNPMWTNSISIYISIIKYPCLEILIKYGQMIQVFKAVKCGSMYIHDSPTSHTCGLVYLILKVIISLYIVPIMCWQVNEPPIIMTNVNIYHLKCTCEDKTTKCGLIL